MVLLIIALVCFLAQVVLWVVLPASAQPAGEPAPVALDLERVEPVSQAA